MAKDSDILPAPTPVAETQGHSSFNAPAKLWARLLSALVDLGWAIALYYFAVRAFGLSPIPHLYLVLPMAAILGLMWILQQIFFGGSIGQLIWRLGVVDPQNQRVKWPDGLLPYLASFFGGRGARVVATEKLTPRALGTAIMLTVVSLVAAFWMARETLWHHPLLRRAEVWELKSYQPPPAGTDGQITWMSLPFFYTLGAWPRTFEGRPVLVTLPYEKGPPERFPGRVIARWKMPHVRLTVEGPKTPTAFESAYLIKACMQAPWNTQGLDRLECLKLREKVLARHLTEMSKISPQTWTVKWFEVMNQALPIEEAPRGIYLKAENDRRTQERFILINERGSHQTFILNRPTDSEGRLAETALQKTVRSMRISSELFAGRALVDVQLAQTKLKELKNLDDSITYVKRLAEIQAMLVSKISVDPRNHEAYYHLGGTAFMLAQHTAQLRVRRHQLLNQKTLFLLDEWSAAAKPLVRSALRFARDVKADHPNTARLEDLWHKVQKY